jgi:hypothetical protein
VRGLAVSVDAVTDAEPSGVFADNEAERRLCADAMTCKTCPRQGLTASLMVSVGLKKNCPPFLLMPYLVTMSGTSAGGTPLQWSS